MCFSSLNSFASSPMVMPWRTGSGIVVDETFLPGVGNRTLNISAGDGVRTVEHDDRLLRLGRRFQKISQRGLVGVEARAHILQIERPARRAC